MIVVVFRHVGTIASESEMLMISVNTSESWSAQSILRNVDLCNQPGFLIGVDAGVELRAGACIALW